jgi:hypothetical protein
LRLSRSGSVTPVVPRVGGSAGTARNSTAARCQPAPGKRTLPRSNRRARPLRRLCGSPAQIPLIERTGHGGAMAAIGVSSHTSEVDHDRSLAPALLLAGVSLRPSPHQLCADSAQKPSRRFGRNGCMVAAGASQTSEACKHRSSRAAATPTTASPPLSDSSGHARRLPQHCPFSCAGGLPRPGRPEADYDIGLSGSRRGSRSLLATAAGH